MNYVVVALLATAAALYAVRVNRCNARRAQRFNRWHAAAFAGTIVTLWVALEPPLDGLADRSFLYHMAQHMLLVYVAAPLFLLSAPMMLAFGSFGTAGARQFARVVNAPVCRFLTFPVFTWLFFTLVMWGAHFSPLYNLALAYPLVHALEHGLFLVSAVLFWQAIVHIGPASWPMNFPLRIVYVFLAMPQSAFLGLALYQSHFVLYPHYVATQGSVAAALSDQHAGGALMWIAGGLLLFAVFMLVAAMWGRYEQRLGERLDAQFDGGNVTAAVIAGVLMTLALAPRPAVAANVDRGKLLYETHCSSCHGANLEGSANGPFLRMVSRNAVDFYLSTGRMPASVPGAQNIGRTPIFSPDDIANIVGFVMSRSSGSNEPVHIDTSGDVVRGRALFIANCSACHGATAMGGSVGYGEIAPSLHATALTQVAQAIRVGPGVMPQFNSSALTNTDVDDIVRYVGILQAAKHNAGGLALGGLGPVAEGLVAWAIGLGLLVIAVRWIGTDA